MSVTPEQLEETLNPRTNPRQVDLGVKSHDQSRLGGVKSEPSSHVGSHDESTLKSGFTPVGIEESHIIQDSSSSGDSPLAGSTPVDTPAHTPTNVASVASDFIQRFVVLRNPETALPIALWVIHTYAMECFSYTPYLHITGPTPACGKTRLLDVLSVLVHKSDMTGSISPSALMRTVHAHHPTLLLDEADTLINKDKDGLVNLLNNGFQRGKTAKVSAKSADGDWTPQSFDVFCPKAIGGIDNEDMPNSLMTRVIRIPMQRKADHQQTDKFRQLRADKEAEPIRKMIAAFLTPEVREQLKTAEPVMPEGLTDRQQDVLEPLVAVADALGIGEEAREALVATMRLSEKKQRDTKETLLKDVRWIFRQHDADFLPSRTVAYELALMEEREWPTLSHGRPITQEKLARMLGPFDIKSIKPQAKGNTERGYLRQHIEKAAAIYVKE